LTESLACLLTYLIEVTVGRTPSGKAHRRWRIALSMVVVQDLLEAIPAQEAILRRERTQGHS
jgi:hypothetical protein